ncbi:MAG: hypothetical protein PHE27_04895 [Alphaproteobacteria bacterium]|nr:hypothetical protein [Alphaproteobacteria bacterium]
MSSPKSSKRKKKAIRISDFKKCCTNLTGLASAGVVASIGLTGLLMEKGYSAGTPSREAVEHIQLAGHMITMPPEAYALLGAAGLMGMGYYTFRIGQRGSKYYKERQSQLNCDQ